jgi:hypothetical protein
MRAVEPGEMGRILELTDRLEIHRESVGSPLGRRDPGGVRRLPGGRIEITVPEQGDFDAWLAGLEPQLRALLG